jgi:hypothetical protein
MLIQLHRNQLQWFCPVKGTEKMRILRRALEVYFEGKRHVGRLGTIWLSQRLEDIRKREKSWQEKFWE